MGAGAGARSGSRRQNLAVYVPWHIPVDVPLQHGLFVFTPDRGPWTPTSGRDMGQALAARIAPTLVRMATFARLEGPNLLTGPEGAGMPGPTPARNVPARSGAHLTLLQDHHFQTPTSPAMTSRTTGATNTEKKLTVAAGAVVL